jgi:hypothetical protein
LAHAEPGQWSLERFASRAFSVPGAASPSRGMAEPLLRFVPGMR